MLTIHTVLVQVREANAGYTTVPFLTVTNGQWFLKQKVDYLGDSRPLMRSWLFRYRRLFFIGRLILCPSGQVINVFFSASKANFFSLNSRWIARRTICDHRLAIGRQILFLLSVGGHLGILIFLKCWTGDTVWRQKQNEKKKTGLWDRFW